MLVRTGLVLIAVVAGLLGVGSLLHPVVLLGFGLPHWSDAPAVIGVGLLVVPVVLAAVGVQRLWQAAAIDEERVRLRRKSKRAQR